MRTVLQIFFSESDIQGRLYYHLCNEFQSDYYRIHQEFDPYIMHLENKPIFIKYDKNEFKVKQGKCIEKYKADGIQKKIKLIAKKGIYDLAILDKKNQELLHVIELKKIISCSDTDYHKGYEDIYLLTDLLDKRCQSYFFVFAVCEYKSEGKKEEMREYVDKINETYNNTNKVHFDSYFYDKSKK